MTPPLKTVGTVLLLSCSTLLEKDQGVQCDGLTLAHLFIFPAFNKMVNVNGQDFNLQLVDTAGQVSCCFAEKTIISL